MCRWLQQLSMRRPHPLPCPTEWGMALTCTGQCGALTHRVVTSKQHMQAAK